MWGWDPGQFRVLYLKYFISKKWLIFCKPFKESFLAKNLEKMDFAYVRVIQHCVTTETFCQILRTLITAKVEETDPTYGISTDGKFYGE